MAPTPSSTDFPYTCSKPKAAEAWKDTRISEIIAQLPAETQSLPRPFTRSDFQHALRATGVQFIRPEDRQQLLDRVLTALNYEFEPWGRYVPRIVDPVAETIDNTSTRLAADLPATLDPDTLALVDTWYEAHGFVQLDNASELLARQAHLNLLLKTTLCETRGVDLPESPDAICKAFRNVGPTQRAAPDLERTVLDTVGWQTDSADLERVFDHRDRLAASPRPARDIAALYKTLLPRQARRPLGQFHTPDPIARVMRAWADVEDGRLLDPGCGPATLSMPTFGSFATKYGSHAATVTGIETDPLSRLMGRTAMALTGQPHELTGQDFFDIEPSDLNGPVDGIVCNPPYLRHQALDADYKRELSNRIHLETGIQPNSTSDLYAYFVYRLGRFLKPGGRAAIITPNFLENAFGKELKQHLQEEFHLRAMLLFDPHGDSVFDDPEVTGLVSFLEAPTESESSSDTRFIRAEAVPHPDALLSAVTGPQSDPDWGTVTRVAANSFDADTDWRRFLNPPDIDLDRSRLTPLSELASVQRGPSTGAAQLFCLSQSTVDKWGIDEGFLSKLARKSTHLDGYEYSAADWERHRAQDHEVWLLDRLENLRGLSADISDARPSAIERTATLPSADDRDPTGLRSYLAAEFSETPGLQDRTVLQNRQPWYQIPRRAPPPVLVTAASRERFRFVRNTADARITNALYGLVPAAELTQAQRNALLAFLNSPTGNEVMQWESRTLQTGLMKLEPSDLEAIPVLDPRQLSADTVDKLAAAFENLCVESGEKVPDSAAMESLDAAVCRVADVDN